MDGPAAVFNRRATAGVDECILLKKWLKNLLLIEIKWNLLGCLRGESPAQTTNH